MPLNIKLSNAADGRKIIFLEGQFDEDIDLEKLMSEIDSSVIIDLAKLTRMTSFGVKQWIYLLKKIPDDCKIEYQNCSTTFIEQANMIANFIQKGKIKSFYAPFICDNGHEFNALLNIEDVKIEDGEYILPNIKCSECSQSSELDDFPEDYFIFLEE